MSITLRFLSADDAIVATCPVRDDVGEVFIFAAVLLGRNADRFAGSVKLTTAEQFWPGTYVRYASRLRNTDRREQMDNGRCDVYGFPTSAARHTFFGATAFFQATYRQAVSQN